MVLALGIDSDDLALVVGWYSAHVVVNGERVEDGDGFPGHVQTGEDHSCLRVSGETGLELLWGEVVELQENVILLRSAASTLASHGTRHNVPGGQILGHRGIPLHEPLAPAVDEVSALSSAPLDRPRRFQSVGTAQTPCPDWEHLKNYNNN